MKHWCILFAYSIWEFWLGRTEKIIARSSWEIVLSSGKRIIERIKKWRTQK